MGNTSGQPLMCLIVGVALTLSFVLFFFFLEVGPLSVIMATPLDRSSLTCLSTSRLCANSHNPALMMLIVL